MVLDLDRNIGAVFDVIDLGRKLLKARDVPEASNAVASFFMGMRSPPAAAVDAVMSLVELAVRRLEPNMIWKAVREGRGELME